MITGELKKTGTELMVNKKEKLATTKPKKTWGETY